MTPSALAFTGPAVEQDSAIIGGASLAGGAGLLVLCWLVIAPWVRGRRGRHAQ